MSLEGNYLGMRLQVHDIDVENLVFFSYCGQHEFRLQRCTACGWLRYPPTTGCPWCSEPGTEWVAVEGRGAVHSYGEVTHAIMPAFRDHLPYLMLLVELDTQRAEPTEHEGIRVAGNLVTPDGALAPPELVVRVGIGSRVRMVFTDVGEGFALPQWTLDLDHPQPVPWRYPDA